MPEPTKAVKPVLSATLPLIKRIVPPVPAVMVGAPLIRMLPPVALPAAVLLPAFSNTAVAVVLVVLTFSDTVKSPVRVSMRTSPVALMPVGFTAPMFKAPAFTYVKADTPLAAKVPTLLLLWSKVTAPPIKASSSATT